MNEDIKTPENETMNDENKTQEEAAMAEKKKTPVEEVEVVIPKDQLNPSDTHVRVGINGKFWTIQREFAVKVPIGVYKILKEAGYNPSVQLSSKE